MPEAFDAQFPVSSTRLRPSVFGRRAHRRTQEKNSATRGTLSSAEVILESLSNNDGDGDDSENVTEKVKSRGLKVNRAYSISFDPSMVGKFFWSLILKDCIKEPEKKRKLVFLCSRPRQIVKLSTYMFVVVQRRLSNVQKRVVRVQSCYLPKKLIAFLLFSLPSPLSMLKVPILP